MNIGRFIRTTLRSNGDYSLIVFLLLVFIFSSCQADQAVADDNDEETALPPPSEDYETNPYQWGFINTSGTLVIADQFDEVRAFSNGLALVRKHGYWGYVNANGQLQIPCKFRTAWSFHEGLARMQDDEGEFGFILPSGKFAIEPKWVEAADFKEGLACVRVGNKYGFINPSGQLVVEAAYERSSRFTNGYAVVKKDDKYGMIDKTGNVIIPFDYQRLKAFSNDLARASQDNKYGFLNKKGIWEVEPMFIQAADFNNNLAPVFDGQSWGLINRKGDWIIPPSYNQLFWAASNRWIAENNDQYQLIDEKATILVDSLDEIHPFKENLAPYRKADLWGYLKMDGQPSTPPLFYLAWPYHDGLARVATEYGITYIDSVGFFVIPPNPNHLELHEFNESLAPVQVYHRN